LYEGPYPEGPGSFSKCGGTAAACLQQAGFNDEQTSSILKCVDNNATAKQALKKMEAYGEGKLNLGKGFPQLYLDGQYSAGSSQTLATICESIAARKTALPAACASFDFVVEFKIAWPIARFNASAFGMVLNGVLSAQIILTVGGDDVSYLISQVDLGKPAAHGGDVAVRMNGRILAGFQKQVLSVPATQSFASALAYDLNATGGFPNITAADITASATPARTTPIVV